MGEKIYPHFFLSMKLEALQINNGWHSVLIWLSSSDSFVCTNFIFVWYWPQTDNTLTFSLVVKLENKVIRISSK